MRPNGGSQHQTPMFRSGTTLPDHKSGGRPRQTHPRLTIRPRRRAEIGCLLESWHKIAPLRATSRRQDPQTRVMGRIRHSRRLVPEDGSMRGSVGNSRKPHAAMHVASGSPNSLEEEPEITRDKKELPKLRIERTADAHLLDVFDQWLNVERRRRRLVISGRWSLKHPTPSS